MQNRIAALEMECAELRGQVLEWKQIARDAATVSLSSQFERRKALPNAVDEMVRNRLLQRIVSLSGRGAITKSQEEYLNMLIGSNDGIHSTNTATSEENLTTAMSPMKKEKITASPHDPRRAEQGPLQKYQPP